MLLVDDDRDVLSLIGFLLTAAGADVDQAGSVREALERIHERAPEVLVSDLGLPGRDGYDLIASVRAERGSRIAALALTGFDVPTVRDRALDCGFDYVLSKRGSADALIETIRGMATPSHAAAEAHDADPFVRT